MEEIINRVANSALQNIDLEDYYDHGERVVYDLKENLFQGIALREKDFRDFVKFHDWGQYEGKNVAITCSVEAIVPSWAYMLLVVHLEPYASNVIYGSPEQMEQYLFQNALAKIDLKPLTGAKVIVKGCGRYPVPTFAYVEISRLLKPIVSSVMYGEACSAVPIFKAPKNNTSK